MGHQTINILTVCNGVRGLFVNSQCFVWLAISFLHVINSSHSPGRIRTCDQIFEMLVYTFHLLLLSLRRRLILLSHLIHRSFMRIASFSSKMSNLRRQTTQKEFEPTTDCLEGSCSIEAERGEDQFVDLSYCLPLVVCVSGLPSTRYYRPSWSVRQPSSAGASSVGASASSVTSGSGSVTPTASRYSMAPIVLRRTSLVLGIVLEYFLIASKDYFFAQLIVKDALVVRSS